MIDKAKIKELSNAVSLIQFEMGRPIYEKDIMFEMSKVIEDTLIELMRENNINYEGKSDLLRKFEELRQSDKFLNKCVKDKIANYVVHTMNEMIKRETPNEDTTTSYTSNRAGISNAFIGMTFLVKGIKKWNKKR